MFLRGFACREGVVLKAREEEAVRADQSCRRGTEAEATEEEEEAKRDILFDSEKSRRVGGCCCCC